MKDKQIDLHRVITVIISIVWMAFQTYIILGKPMNPMLQVPVHLVFALAIIYLYNPIDKKNEKCYTYSKDGKVTDPAYTNVLFNKFFPRTAPAETIEKPPLLTKIYLTSLLKEIF